jgi:hypothetical protein
VVPGKECRAADSLLPHLGVFSGTFLFESSISSFLRFDWVATDKANSKTLVRANFRQPYRTRGSRHIDHRCLDAGCLLPVGIVVKIGGNRQTEKCPTVLSAQLTRDRVTIEYVNPMCDAPILLHTNKKRLSGSSCPNGAFGVRADAERAHSLEVCEDLSMQQYSVAIDLESEKPIAERFRDQQIMRTCNSQPVRIGDVIGNRSNIAVRHC